MSGYAIRDLFTLRWVDAPRLAPDGTRIAYLETRLDEAADRTFTRVVVAAADGSGARAVEVPSATGVAWSPAGDRLAVAGDGLWLHSVGDGSTRRIAPRATAEPDWSPDGTRVAVAVDSRGLAVVGLDGSVTAVGPHGAKAPRWSPHGRCLAFVADGVLWTIGADLAGPARPVASPAGAVIAFAWSPDSATLAVLTRPAGDPVDVGRQLWLVPAAAGAAGAAGAARQLLGPAEAALGSAVRGDDPRGTGTPALCWSPASGRVYLESAWHGRGPLAWVHPDGSSGRLFDGPHACLAPDLAAGRLAVVISGPDAPGDVWIADEDGGGLRRVSDVDSATAQRAVPTAHLEIGHDGVTVDAWLTGASSGSPAPLIVNVHGGPYYAIGWRFTFEVQRLAAQGAYVLTLNPRGSSGRGDAFAAGNRGDWGGVDAADVLAAVDAVAARPEIDGSRVALWGVSYGGFMTQWLLSRSDAFRTAISENGISDLGAMWASDPAGRPFWELALGGPPGASERYGERSPLNAVERIRTPLLLVHAEQDHTCSIAQSERMARALRAAGAQHEFVRLPGEGHLVNLVGRPSSRLRRAAAVDDWLARTLR